MTLRTRHPLVLALVLVATAAAFPGCGANPHLWSAKERTTLHSLWIGSLKPLPPDPSNKYGDDLRAARLGQKLFFDTRFSSNGKVACATCHHPDQLFQDGLPLAIGVGITTRRTMTIIGTAYSPWFFWDGSTDSQWSQATDPMEGPDEHGGTRGQYAHLIADFYRTEYEAIFGPLPDLSNTRRFPILAGPVENQAASKRWNEMRPEDRMSVSRVYANMGKAIAAYERKIMPGPSRFDQYVEAVLKDDLRKARSRLTPHEVAGLRLFIGKGECTKCHNGPLFTNNDFHNTGVPAAPNLSADIGRAKGAVQVLKDEFNCLGPFSDASTDHCAELRFMVVDEKRAAGQFKPPSLRNVAERAPYMHAGQFKTLEEVLGHYNRAPAAPVGKSELKPLGLTDTEIADLIAFLKTLSGPLATEPEWLVSPKK